MYWEFKEEGLGWEVQGKVGRDGEAARAQNGGGFCCWSGRELWMALQSKKQLLKVLVSFEQEKKWYSHIKSVGLSWLKEFSPSLFSWWNRFYHGQKIKLSFCLRCCSFYLWMVLPTHLQLPKVAEALKQVEGGSANIYPFAYIQVFCQYTFSSLTGRSDARQI